MQLVKDSRPEMIPDIQLGDKVYDRDGVHTGKVIELSAIGNSLPEVAVSYGNGASTVIYRQKDLNFIAHRKGKRKHAVWGVSDRAQWRADLVDMGYDPDDCARSENQFTGRMETYCQVTRGDYVLVDL